MDKPGLFARLAKGHAEGITVVTPNKRLAQALVLEFDSYQVGRGLASWEAADILPFDAWVQRFHEEAMYTDAGAGIPLLLTGAQEQALWEEALAGSGLLVLPHAAAQARAAWELQHRWRLGEAGGNADADAFAAWSKRYRARTRGDVDAARLPDLLAGFLKDLKKPRLVVAYAFDVVPPQAGEFLSHFTVEACAPEPVAGRAVRASYPSAKEELEAAAGWARARLEEGKKRIGIVVPDLQLRRKQVVRVFARVMGGRAPFNVSLGEPLTQYPVVAHALLLLRLSQEELPFEAASKLLRSPFLAGAEAEMAARARLDARLREEAPARLGLGKLAGLAQSLPVFRSLLEKIFSIPKPPASGPHEWARYFTAVLAAAGWPGERPLDSDEFQARAKFEEVLGEFARLEKVLQRIPFEKAPSILARQCDDTLFQPESGDAPVQVLGVLESAGLSFDALWVSGLTDDAWPLGARPNPFLPIARQRAAGLPQASAEASLALSRKITEGWMAAAPEVVFSHPAMEEDRELVVSSLIKEIKPGNGEAKTFPRHRDLIFAARRLESIPDGQAPALAGKPRGGTRILADQAACPFRAFARHRLAAEALGEAKSGPDALERGTMLHLLMKEIWKELKDSTALDKDTSAAIARAAKVAAAGLEEPLRGMEEKRLAKLAREWLAVEKTRSPFAVINTETPIPLSAGPLRFEGRIDRMDRLESGGHAVIDYKSGKATPKDWLGPRPDEPQLPLYALSVKEEVTAVAFAKLKTGDMKFSGFSREKAIEGVKPAKDWPALLAGWRKEIDALGTGFAAGAAKVDPKDGISTCRYCDLHTLCRVYERVNALEEGEGEE